MRGGRGGGREEQEGLGRIVLFSKCSPSIPFNNDSPFPHFNNLLLFIDIELKTWETFNVSQDSHLANRGRECLLFTHTHWFENLFKSRFVDNNKKSDKKVLKVSRR